MKLLVIGTIDADFDNREEIFCERLLAGLNKRNHEVDICYLPFKRDMLSAVEQIFAYSLVDTTRAEALITVGYPACFVPHRDEKKIIYLFDCYPEIHCGLGFKLREHRVEERLIIAKKITFAESKVFRNAKKIFAATQELSREVSARYSITADVMLPDDADLAERVECAIR